jgi:hypothetical protein
MPGLVPGIHVLAALKTGKTRMAGTSPAMTKNNHFQVGRKSMKMLDAFSSELKHGKANENQSSADRGVAGNRAGYARERPHE